MKKSAFLKTVDAYKVTRNTKVGFGYRSWLPGDHALPEKPYHIGTVRTVEQKIREDNNFQAMRDTLLVATWFVWDGITWIPVVFTESIWSLTDKLYGKYYCDHILAIKREK